MHEKNKCSQCSRGINTPLLFALILVVLLSVLHMFAPTLLIFGIIAALGAKIGMGFALLCIAVIIACTAGVLGFLAAVFSLGIMIILGIAFLVPLIIFTPLLILASPALLLLCIVLLVFRHGHKHRAQG